jgi:hypothetical protein
MAQFVATRETAILEGNDHLVGDAIRVEAERKAAVLERLRGWAGRRSSGTARELPQT